MENSSGQGATAIVPCEINKWNWGAFLLHWIWGVGNKTLISLLIFVPFVNIAMPFVLGFKGSQWAWKNKKWESVEQFKATQRSWAKWGFILYGAFIVFFVGLSFLMVSAFKSSDVFDLAVTRLEANQHAIQLLGEPISTGFPMGNIEVSGPSGIANFSFSAEGARGKGTVYMDAVKEVGEWRVNQIVFEEKDTGYRIDLAR